MSERFKKIYNIVIAWEGGHVNHPDDPGGETYKGISRKNHPNWAGWKLIDAKKPVPEILVKKFYEEHFWKRLRCEEMPYPVGEYLFDFAVNVGASRAARILQTIVGVAVDGIIGAITLGAVQKQNPTELMYKLLFERVGYYITITMQRRQFTTFFFGWIRRTHDVFKRLMTK
jgi:lysozyme family protein